MTALKERLRGIGSNANQRVMTRIIERGDIPRLGFQHYFIEADGLHSRLHLQNFYSTFFPHVEEAVHGTIEVFSREGRALGSHEFTLPPFGSLFLEARELLDTIGSSEPEGSLTVDLHPPKQVLRELADFPLPDPWSLRISTPFWMAFYDADENYMYVHSIDRYAGAFHGVPGPVAWMLRRKFEVAGEDWRSGRLLDAHGITELQIVVLNHSSDTRSATLGLYSRDGRSPLVTERVELGPHALRRVRLDLEQARQHLGEGDEGLVQLGVDPLPTLNGKPYVLMRYGDGPLSLHHG